MIYQVKRNVVSSVRLINRACLLTIFSSMVEIFM